MAHNLIASDRVEGTTVCRPGGKKIGVIRRLMIDKVSGKVAYAVLTFGGFLHFGPVPWAALSYNAVLQAYEVDITDEQLHDAPLYVGDLEFDWGDRSREVSIHKVYRTAHYWE